MGCTLLVDGNWLLMSRLSVHIDSFKIDISEEDRRHAIDRNVELMAKSIVITLNRFRDIIDDMIIVSDGHSWRKDVCLPKSISDFPYKGNRVQDDNIDWESVYCSLKTLMANCARLGITVSHVKDAEGDDCIMHWSKRLNEEGTNVIIWSYDNDLKQLVDFNGTNFTLWYNDKGGLFASKMLSYDNDMDFFLDMGYAKMNVELIDKISKASGHNVIYMLKDDIVMEKIICGDVGDNIKSIVRVKSGSKEYKVSKKIWQSIKEDLGIHSLEDFDANKEEIVDKILSVKRLNKCSSSKEEIFQVMEFNKRMVELDKKNMPSYVVEQLESLEHTKCDLSYVIDNYSVMSSIQSEVESLFDSIA